MLTEESISARLLVISFCALTLSSGSAFAQDPAATEAPAQETAAEGETEAAPASAPAPDLEDELRKAYGGRTTIANSEKVVELLVKKLETEPTNAKEWARLSYAYYWLAELKLYYGKADEDQLLALHDKGKQAGEKAAQLDAGLPAAFFWQGVNTALWQKYEGVSWSALNFFPTVEKLMNKTNALNPNFFHGGVNRFWGQTVVDAGFLAKFKGYGIDEAIEFFENSRKISKDFMLTNVYFAAALVDRDDDGDMDKAKQLLEEAVAKDISRPAAVWADNFIAQNKAKKLLKKHFSE